MACPKTMAGVAHLQWICKGACRVAGAVHAGAVHETCSSEMFGGQAANFLRRVAFWSMRSSGSLLPAAPSELLKIPIIGENELSHIRETMEKPINLKYP